MITLNQFKILFPNCLFRKQDLDTHYTVLTAEMFKNEIIGKNRECMFLAQCAHESLGFSKVEENLNYSANALLKQWPKRFTREEAMICAYNPVKIANKVYGNRMGNDVTDVNDGWDHRGKGILQLTGEETQEEFLRSVGYREKNTNILMSPEYSAKSAVWFWGKINGNQLADWNDFAGITKRINGQVGPDYESRERWLIKLKSVLY